jgi:hypothetical protein
MVQALVVGVVRVKAVGVQEDTSYLRNHGKRRYVG